MTTQKSDDKYRWKLSLKFLNYWLVLALLFWVTAAACQWFFLPPPPLCCVYTMLALPSVWKRMERFWWAFFSPLNSITSSWTTNNKILLEKNLLRENWELFNSKNWGVKERVNVKEINHKAAVLDRSHKIMSKLGEKFVDRLWTKAQLNKIWELPIKWFLNNSQEVLQDFFEFKRTYFEPK